ncbi:hypothetical protein NAP1_11573 [Erythrobacter sp. NAP1]|uniref:O-antigen ligase family protein n=1 Tax=Erythrobacter sp. NAP1 TaxID=237727 RepID=UPI000068793F|nr:O-antigen ligase family protein [Erythrobacter sp. NAP1]EAQ28232.1 hypothetical protein NAP1_11573 [Erythrobacter sp. NAP1]
MTNENTAERKLLWAGLAILAAAFAFGGGGSKYGSANLIVQLIALVALSFHRAAFFDFWRTAPLSVKALTGLTILLPVLQIVPLPASVWNALPGRELMIQSLELVNANDWATLSVDPIRTLLALSAIIAPLAILTIGWQAPRGTLITLGWFAVAIGLVNLALGVPQVLSNSEVGVLYPENPMPGVLFGTFANRNSTGVFLVGALAFAALLLVPARFQQLGVWARPAICALLLLAILLTRSRTAIVLAAIPLGLVAMKYILARLGSAASARAAWVAIIPAVLVIGAVGMLAVTSPGRVAEVVDRFEGSGTDARVFIWEDAAYSAQRYFPVGSGMGTFDDVFQIDESLENMTLRRAGRAHNDYLEVAIEAGVPGLVLIAAWLVLLAGLAWRARKARDRWIAWSGGTFLLAAALQSITDYPLRNQSLLVFGAFALVILIRFGTDEAGRPARTEKQA